MWIFGASCDVFFLVVWKDTGDIKDLISRILVDVAYCIGIFIRDPVYPRSFSTKIVVGSYGYWKTQIVLLWDPLDLGSCIRAISWDPRDPGSSQAVCRRILWSLAPVFF